ncbi:MAG: BamA/TamA family outer membrane protein, partial [Myxococcota bacterium]
IDLPYLALRLPQYLVEVAFVPLMPIVTLFERYSLFDRFLDLVTNEEGTAALLPLVDPFNNAGLGAGAVFLYNEPFGSQDRFISLGQIYPNRDRIFSVSFTRRFPTLSGRRVSLSASYNVDHDTRFFGFGADRPETSQQLLRTDAVDAAFGITLINPTRLPEYFVEVAVAYRRRKLGTGNGNLGPGLTPQSGLPLPAGFRQALDYPELTLSTEYDSRDSFGVTSKGLFARLRVTGTRDVNSAQTSAIRADGVFAAFVPLLPRFRTLFVKVGASATAPLPIGDGEMVPMHMMANLGGSTDLRGYVSDRFIDRLGWWATVEYRYRFFDYADQGMGISSALFADVGRVGPTVSDLIKSPMPWSVGLGLRLEQNLILAGRIQFAYSPEGFRFS